MNKLKNKKGITLIALVVTVVVLIILAGVSINAVIGDDGIIAKARENAKTTKETSKKEAMNRLVLEYQLAKTDESLEDFLKAKVPGEIDKVTNNGDGTLTVEKDEVKITVDAIQTSTPSNPSKPSKPSNSEISLDDLHVGDYVNYSYGMAESYTVESKYGGKNQSISQTVKFNWKILNIDKENRIVDIVSENPTNETLYLGGILGYYNGTYFLNEICKKQYSNSDLGVEARSINLLDMEKHLTDDGIMARNNYQFNSNFLQYGKTKTHTSSGFNYYPKLYENQKGAGVNTTNITQPDITKGNDPYEESKAIATTEPVTDYSYGQATSSGLTVTQTYYSIAIDSKNYGEAATVLSSKTKYWVAARCVFSSISYCEFGMRNANTNTDWTFMWGGNLSSSQSEWSLRPLVSLKFDLFTGTKDYGGAWNLKD